MVVTRRIRHAQVIMQPRNATFLDLPQYSIAIFAQIPTSLSKIACSEPADDRVCHRLDNSEYISSFILFSVRYTIAKFKADVGAPVR